MKCIIRNWVLVISAAVVGACASVDHSGAYAPGCMAMAGDTIDLDGDRFVWDKFTDEVRVDPEGKVEDQFPAHPMQGHFEVENDKLILRPDSDGVTSVFYLVEDGDNRYVLNVVQHSEWQATGAIPECSLVRDAQHDS